MMKLTNRSSSFERMQMEEETIMLLSNRLGLPPSPPQTQPLQTQVPLHQVQKPAFKTGNLSLFMSPAQPSRANPVPFASHDSAFRPLAQPVQQSQRLPPISSFLDVIKPTSPILQQQQQQQQQRLPSFSFEPVATTLAAKRSPLETLNASLTLRSNSSSPYSGPSMSPSSPFSPSMSPVHGHSPNHLFGSASCSPVSAVHEPLVYANWTPSTISSLPATKKAAVNKPVKEKAKQSRPKLAGSSAVQCIGVNRKKGVQCRNAALMEYIGPKPKYCAEHIHLDPDCLHAKCLASISSPDRPDAKGCREIVLKEFKYCHKHLQPHLESLINEGHSDKVIKLKERCATMTTQLENETTLAKKNDPDLCQRKNKILPKYYHMKQIFKDITQGLQQ